MAGSYKITDKTPEVIRQITQLTGDRLVAFTEDAVSEIKTEAPYDTGNHRSLIAHGPGEKSFGGKATSMRIFSQSGYGAYLEFGTSRMTSQPHFAPGIRSVISDWKRDGVWGE